MSRQDSAARAAGPALRRQELVYVSDRMAGIRRLRQGRGFAYVTPAGITVRSQSLLARIRRLAIPPAYRNVWICRDPRGHLQATGRDARGRKQYRYHPDWRVSRDDSKFDRMKAFAVVLPRLRARVAKDLRGERGARPQVLAGVVKLLDTTLARVGNEEYARENRSFGLTTLRKSHVHEGPKGSIRLVFRAKGGAPHDLVIRHRRLRALIRQCQECAGERLFKWVDDKGRCHPIDSDQVNAYVREASGGAFSAKDFRTWGATRVAAALLARTPLPSKPSERALRACEIAVVRAVAGQLRNTAAVCRKAYISPRIFRHWRSGRLHASFAKAGEGPRIDRRMLALL